MVFNIFRFSGSEMIEIHRKKLEDAYHWPEKSTEWNGLGDSAIHEIHSVIIQKTVKFHLQISSKHQRTNRKNSASET